MIFWKKKEAEEDRVYILRDGKSVLVEVEADAADDGQGK